MRGIPGVLGWAAAVSALVSCQAPLAPPPRPDAAVVGTAKVAKMAATPELQSVALPDLFDLLRQPNPPLVCDARMGMLYRLGHIPGAISLPAGNWEEAFAAHRAELEAARAAGRRLVFYCVDPECPDARKTATWAARQGFSGVLVYEGGMQEWKEAGMPVE